MHDVLHFFLSSGFRIWIIYLDNVPRFLNMQNYTFYTWTGYIVPCSVEWSSLKSNTRNFLIELKWIWIGDTYTIERAPYKIIHCLPTHNISFVHVCLVLSATFVSSTPTRCKWLKSLKEHISHTPCKPNKKFVNWIMYNMAIKTRYIKINK